MKRGTPSHPKMYDLAAALNIPRAQAVGIMEMLWHYCGQHAPQGDIGRASNVAIARAVEWDSDPQELVDALLSAGWLDTCEQNRLVVHDWAEHCEDSVKKYLQRNNKPFVIRVTGFVQTKSDDVGKNPPSRAGQEARGKGQEAESEKQEKTSLPENQPAPPQTVDQRPAVSVSRAFEQPAGDPFEAAGFSGEFEMRLWFEDLVKRHPNKTRNKLAHSKLRYEILCGRFSRAEFEAWHAQSMHNPRWHEAGGHYAPNLYSILDDCLWKHAPPDFTDPQVFSKPKGRSVMDDV